MSQPPVRRYAQTMPGPHSINPPIVEALYVEAVTLADAARTRFEMARTHAIRAGRTSGRDARDGACDVDMACEALRTSTRVMHCLAWLLNHRAWFAGEITADQLRRHGRLVTHFPASDPAIVTRLPHDVRALVIQSERLYARLQRLEQAWRTEMPVVPDAIERLRDRLAIPVCR